jgi:hypothetical protein
MKERFGKMKLDSIRSGRKTNKTYRKEKKRY